MEQRQKEVKLLAVYRKTGDPRAIDALVLENGTSLFSLLVALTRNRQDAEEIFQETWLKVMKNAGGFHGGSFKAWLTTIARRTWIDRLRKKSPSLSLDREDENGIPAIEKLESNSAPHPLAFMESSEEMEAIRHAVSRLPDDQREVFLMRTMEELSFAEIAKSLSIPLNTALGKMHYAVLKLRKELNRNEKND